MKPKSESYQANQGGRKKLGLEKGTYTGIVEEEARRIA